MYVVLLLAPWLLRAEDTFPMLEVGSQVYSNVTVTSKTPRYIMIMHTKGLASLKLKDLSPDLLRQLGYQVDPPLKAQTAGLSHKIVLDPRIRELQEKAVQQIQERVRQLGPRVVQGVLAGLLLLYLLFCYCSMLICKKAGCDPGVLVWIPGLQVFPLLKAAGMSGWCFLLLLLPFASLIVGIFWCVKICQARGKSSWLALGLLLPVTYPLTYLYLAFADGLSSEDSVPERITFN